MKIGLNLIGILQGAVALVAIAISQHSMAEEPWKLAKDDDGIKVYTRHVADSPLKEFRGEIQLSTSPEKVVQVLKDANAFKKWMPDVIVSDLLQSSESEQYHYLENAAPWPVSNRDGIYHFTYTKAEEAGIVSTIVRVEAAPTYSPPKAGKVRVPISDGSWKIVPANGAVLVTYQMHAIPGGSLPDWLANTAAVDTPFNTLKNLRAYIRLQLVRQTGQAIIEPSRHVVATVSGQL